MRNGPLAATMLAGAFMLVTGALAKDSWRTVTLGGDPDFTISIPAAVKDYGGGKNPDDLMFFSVTSSGYGSLSCFANRADYPKDSTQTVFAAALATTKREVFCGQNGGTRSGLDIGGSKSFTHNGFQAAICTASYTDSAEKQRGRVTSQMVVAAPRNVYFVTCTVEDEDQEVAEYSWAMLWEDSVSHIQQSFHLPK